MTISADSEAEREVSAMAAVTAPPPTPLIWAMDVVCDHPCFFGVVWSGLCLGLGGVASLITPPKTKKTQVSTHISCCHIFLPRSPQRGVRPSRQLRLRRYREQWRDQEGKRRSCSWPKACKDAQRTASASPSTGWRRVCRMPVSGYGVKRQD